MLFRSREEHGNGVEGIVAGRRVAVGKSAWITQRATLPPRAREVRRRSSMEGSSCVFVAIDGSVAAAFLLDDPVRPDGPRVIRSLRRAGIRRVVMVTGDHPDVAESVGISLGVDQILSERDPADKVDAVRAEREVGLTGGHVLHAEPGLDQWFAWRPLLGHARYRFGLPGLYLCGSGAHAGGGVTGGAGENGAATASDAARTSAAGVASAFIGR